MPLAGVQPRIHGHTNCTSSVNLTALFTRPGRSGVRVGQLTKSHDGGQLPVDQCQHPSSLCDTGTTLRRPSLERHVHRRSLALRALCATAMTYCGGGGGGLPCLEKSESTNSGAKNPCHFLKMSEQIMQGWQKLLIRNSGRLLLFPGGLSWCINQHSCLHPIECHRNTTNEETLLRHFWDFHGKLITISQIPWHGTSEKTHSPTHTLANP